LFLELREASRFVIWFDNRLTVALRDALSFVMACISEKLTSESIVASKRGYGSGASDSVEYNDRNAVSVAFLDVVK
jgi:hypothetical protein